MENFLYSLLSAADDDFKKGYENLLVNAYNAAEQSAQMILQSNQDPALRKKLEEKLTEIASTVHNDTAEEKNTDS